MGLSGRKVKQRIPNDPRNLSWADDAARFGSSYLSKFGWDVSQGLGVGGEGRKTHIKVEQKLDMMGIGAAHQKDPNGIAWKQNKDFENLLKRLNDANGNGSGSGDEGIVVDGFVKPKEEEEVKKTEDVDEEKVRRKKEKKEKKEKKREKKEKKRKEKDVGEKEKKKKRKREDDDGADKKSKKKKRRDEDTDSDSGESSKSKSPEPVVVKQVVRAVPRHRAHRARAIAAKSIASKSAAAISEILGIAPSDSTSQTSSGTQTPREGKLTSIYDNGEDLGLEKITTSTKSMQDYFKEKMSQLKLSTVAIVQKETVEVDYDDIPRGGLGSRPKIMEENDAPRIGLSKFSSLMSSSFMAATSQTTFTEEVEGDDEQRARKKEKKEKKRLES